MRASSVQKVKVIPGDSIVRVAEQASKVNVGHGTYLQEAIDKVKDDYDNAIVFSDMQLADYYLKHTGGLKKVYCFNLAAYPGRVAANGKVVEFS